MCRHLLENLRHRVQNLERELAARDQSQGNAGRSHGGASQSHARTHSPSHVHNSQARSLIRREETHTQATSRPNRSKSEGRWGSQKEEDRNPENPIIIGATPCHPSILKVRLPRNFDKPMDMRYDGTKDPQEHVTAFEARMNLEGVGDAVRCRAFPVTPAGPAIRWFNTLPQGSITTFADISQKFLARFTTRIAKAKHLINLLGVTQKPGEPTRKFLDRFNNECLEIDGLTDSVASLCLTNGLLNEDFRKHLTTRPVWTMQEIQSIAKEYINDKEVSQVVAANKRQPPNPPPRHAHQTERYKEAPRDSTPNKLPKQPRVYQQIADKGILSRPRPLKERTEGNKSLYCDYHKGFGHKTQDCFDFKDALEQAIREGKLNEFSRLIREPRRRERERSEEDRNRAVKPRQEPPADANNPPAFVVNVVVGQDSPPNSKSATRKDSRVLSITTESPTASRKPPTISFGPEDKWFNDLPENSPMVVTAMIGTGLVKRILVDTGADSNILFRNVFVAMGFKESDLQNHQHGVMGLDDNFIKPDGTISLPISLGTGNARRSVMADFVVLRDSTAYNIILGWKTINEFSAVICTKFLTMKFMTDKGTVGSIRGDLETAVACDNASLSLRKESKKAAGVFLADLDAWIEDKPRLEPEGDMEKFQIGKSGAIHLH
ncbi:uncharacterized protein LOC107640915 [Arachis ipaensis]|uniref:uncharacterized protein LOC107640915 n=1 Tax=Arachis ipaensis TaxID=130454 RepID=UPI0007AFDF31|nr:uncharacterized protein LOC107640915 [Arachis ipaensis]XP_025652860.1 uncharacterized protein LOC112748831 [Arachis hypogaea]